MKIFKSTSINNNYKNSVIAIGNFDGIHIGHKKVLKSAYKKAKKMKKKFGLLTFEPVPVMFFNKKIINHRIDTLPQKISNLKKGANIYLEGQLTTRKWRDEKSGQDKYSTEVVLQGYNSSLTMLDGKNRTNNASEKSALPNDQTSQDNSDLDDEIPF